MNWKDKAIENEQKWGSQSVELLLLAMGEEFGELIQAYLEYMYEDGDPADIADELDDVVALGYQIDWRLSEGFDTTVRCVDCGLPINRQKQDVRRTDNGVAHSTCPVIPE